MKPLVKLAKNVVCCSEDICTESKIQHLISIYQAVRNYKPMHTEVGETFMQCNYDVIKYQLIA